MMELTDARKVGPYGFFFFIGNIISSCLALFWLVVGVYNLTKLVRLRQFKADALSFSLLVSILALLNTMIQTMAINRFSFQVVTPDEFGRREDTSRLGTVFLALSFCFTTISLLNVSLIWAEIATNVNNVRTNSRQAGHWLTTYRKVLIGYYFVTFGALIISLALGQVFGLVLSLTAAAVVAIPGTLFVIITYILASLRVRKMLNVYVAANETLSGSASPPGYSYRPEVVQSIKVSVRAVQYAAFGVSTTSLLFAICVGWWVLAGGLVDHPTKQVNLIPLTLLWFWVAAANSVVMWYLNGTIRRRERSLNSCLTGSSSVRRIENMENGPLVVLATPLDSAIQPVPAEKRVLRKRVADGIAEVESFSSPVFKG